ncbi:MAG TPA: prepilin-type N-terminal cleavage/methylation domain-containing protein [Syntrophales bacterium]
MNGHNRGFTLLELLIALTITAMIVAIIFGALRIGIRAWEKGENVKRS